MARHILYAYVEGSDLHGISEGLEAEFTRLVSEANWICAKPWVVNQRRDEDPSLGPGDLPDWELGLNVELPDPGKEPSGWFGDVEKIAFFLGRLHARTARTFVVGIGDTARGISEDLYFVRDQHPDIATLRKIIGVGGAG
jgi:hypothetical protein